MKGYVDPSTVSTESVQVLKPDGTLVPDHGYDLDLKEEDLREIYRVMILTRKVDQESTNLQRQGELGVYTPALGQEGAQVGAAYALEPLQGRAFHVRSLRLGSPLRCIPELK